MTTLALFNKRMRELGKRVDRNVPKLLRRVGLAVDQAVVTATPVDTGRARSNWRVSVNSPLEDTVEAYVPGMKGSTGGANTGAALAQGVAAVSRVDSGRDVIYISNNLPYIGRLNDGHSAQAPAGYVQTAIGAATSTARVARLLERSLK